MSTEQKSIVQLKAALREKEMQRLILMSQLGLSLYKEDEVKKQYASKFAKLFEKISDNAIEMAQIEADIDLASKPQEEEKVESPFPEYQPSKPEPAQENLIPCPQCKVLVKDTDTFCFSCGTHLSTDPEEPDSIEETPETAQESVIPVYEIVQPAKTEQPEKTTDVEEGKIEDVDAAMSENSDEPKTPELVAEEPLEVSEAPEAPVTNFIAVRAEEIVSEGAQLIAKAKEERQRRTQEKKEQEEREKKEKEAAAKAAAAPKNEGRLRINPDKVKEDKEAEAKRQQEEKEEQEKQKEEKQSSKRKTRKRKSAPKVFKTRSKATRKEQEPESSETVEKEPVSVAPPAPEQIKDMPNLRFDEDDSDDDFDPWGNYDEDNDVIEEIASGPEPSQDTPVEETEESKESTDVLNDMVEKKKNQKGTWEESLATLETEIDPFAGLEKKRKRSFKKDLVEMSEKTPSATKQTVKVNDISDEPEEVKCPNCGHIPEKGTPFCPMCGEKLQ